MNVAEIAIGNPVFTEQLKEIICRFAVPQRGEMQEARIILPLLSLILVFPNTSKK